MGNSMSSETTKLVINDIWTKLDRKDHDQILLKAGAQKSRSTGKISQALAKAFTGVSKVPHWEILSSSGPSIKPEYVTWKLVPGTVLKVPDFTHHLLMSAGNYGSPTSSTAADLTNTDYIDLFQALLVLQRLGSTDEGLFNGLLKIKDDIRNLAMRLTCKEVNSGTQLV